MAHRFGLDSLVIREGRFYGWGWFLDDEARAVRCELRLRLRAGGEQAVMCVPAGTRDDLRQAYPQVPHAASAGFLLQGRLRGTLDPLRPAQLVATLANGEVRRCDVHNLLQPGAPTNVFLRVTDRVRREGVRALLDAIRARAGARLHAARTHRRLLRRLRRWAGRTPLTLVLDHGMGGGANHYRRALVDRLASDGAVLVVCPVLQELSYHVELRMRDCVLKTEVPRLEPVLRLLERVQLLNMHVNELVSYAEPLELLEWLRAQRARRAGELVFHLHDYHAACPSWTLVDHTGSFCGVPDPAVCRTCLPANTANTMDFTPDVTVPQWRAAWAAFLQACDRIVAFSHASVGVLAKAHPGLPHGKVTVQPHKIDVRFRPIQPNPGPPLVIGAVGHLTSAPKGARILREMARLIRERNLPMRIVVFGTLEQHDGGDGIDVLGEYALADLPNLLERHRVGVCLLPSVCAETYSFVTAELMAMRAPLAVFPIGAPAERVLHYDLGLVISRIDPSVALEEISAFAARVLARADAAPTGQ
ncbi:MAG TPA: glycosyltransferase [Lysobacter sp.]|nr:glycosyltransferase [Lysobacter sp.]